VSGELRAIDTQLLSGQMFQTGSIAYKREFQFLEVSHLVNIRLSSFHPLHSSSAISDNRGYGKFARQGEGAKHLSRMSAVIGSCGHLFLLNDISLIFISFTSFSLAPEGPRLRLTICGHTKLLGWIMDGAKRSCMSAAPLHRATMGISRDRGFSPFYLRLSFSLTTQEFFPTARMRF